MMALFAVFAFSAVAAANASAEEWLQGGKPITTAQAGLLDGLILLKHTGGLFGTSVIHCTGQFHGTFGPGSKDTITDVLGLSGELNRVHCEFNSGACGVGALAWVTARHLPWLTKLVLPGTPAGTWDEISEGETKAGTPGYEAECPSLGVKVICEHNARAKFLANGTNGAELEFKEAESLEASCNDGGKAVLSGLGEALGFTIS